MSSPTARIGARFAVLIGINDYSTYDVSAGAPPGTHDLQGALNDVLLMHRQCLRLGYDPNRIVICTHPKMDPLSLGLPANASNVRGASKAELQEVFSVLGTQVGPTGGALGLIYYGGHGATDADGHLVLCPSDTALVAGALVNTIDTAEVQKHLPTGVDVVLDCCHAGAGRNLTPGATPGSAETRFRPRDSLLAAAAPDQVAEERVLGGRWHGAFTFVLSVLLEQWDPDLDGARPWVAVTHETLRARSQAMLRALDLAQVPVYSGPPNVVFGMVPGAEATSANAETRSMQIWAGDDAGYKYFQVNANNVQIGWFVTLGANCPTSSLPTAWRSTFQAGNEYWAWKAGQSAFPGSFTLVPQSTWDNSMPTATSAWTRIPCVMLATSPTFALPSGTIYQVVAGNTPTSAFYMKRAGANPVTQSWYASGSGSSKWVGDGASNVTFTSVSVTGSGYGKTVLTES